MATSDPNLPNLRELALPAKDLARGLKHTIAQSRRLTAPMRDALPEGVRDLARGFVSGIEGLAGSARDAVGRGASRRANSLVEILAGSDPAVRFARAAVFGLEGALQRLGRSDLMASETVAAVAYHAVSHQGAPAEVAARLALALHADHAAGVAPGTPLGMGAEEVRVSLLACVAVMLWMMVEREAAPEDEGALLGLCVDVVGTLEAEIGGADAEALAGLIATYAAVV